MAFLFGHEYSKKEILSRVGDLSQVAGIRMMQLKDGSEAGVRIADLRTGSGLRFQVSLDRGMDISIADYKGLPLAWRSASGDVHPSYFDPRGTGWGRSFPGGLMTGCGMSFLGAPCVDAGEELGLHGRLSNLPASGVGTETHWENDTCVMQLHGLVRESGLFKENLLLHRTIETRLGESLITISDHVRNEGYQTSPLMMLYHINAGWPLVDEGSRLLLNSKSMKPRDAEAEKGVHDASTFSSPASGYREQVFFHDLLADADGFVTALLMGSKARIGLCVRFRQKELSRYIEWKMMGEGTYVVGMEPANCGVGGRAKERAAGTLQFLEPGEERRFLVQIGVVDGEKELSNFIEKNALT
ncbi:MAG TPA: aldose 1-epimerase family protein [Bacteroidota bacterium]